MTLKAMAKIKFSSSKTPSLVSQLVRGRLHFYIQTTADAIKRHQFIILTISMLLGPMFFVVLLASAKPLMSLLDAVNAIDSMQIWGVFLLLHVMWSRFQQKAYIGGPSFQYLQTLPLSTLERIHVECKVIFYLGSLLFIPFMIAVIYFFIEKGVLQAIIGSALILLWGIGLLLILVQLISKNTK